MLPGRVLTDRFARPLRSLRLSVTDRCNLRCQYCMPEDEYRWLARQDVLTFEEMIRLVGLLTGLGVRRLRLTGGEPLLRRDLLQLVEMLAGLPQLDELAMTTNGLLLAPLLEPLRQRGLQRLTISIDSLRPEVFRRLAQRDGLDQVIAAIRAARGVFEEVKLDTVLLSGVNDDEIPQLLAFAHECACELRFIEYMDVGGATRWSSHQVVSRKFILDAVAREFGVATPLEGRGSAPAERFSLPHGQVFGIIASVTHPFCSDCDRARLTADGHLLTCLYARDGLDLRAAMRAGASDQELLGLLSRVWAERRDRGAEERAALPSRGSFVPLEELRRDPRLEMHTRGG